MSDLQNSRRAAPGQPAVIFVTHWLGLTAGAGVPFALGHRELPAADFFGVALGCLAWAAVAALEARIQPAPPAPVAAEDSPWRQRALSALLALPFAAATDAAYHPLTLAGGTVLIGLGALLRTWSLATLGHRFTWTTGVIAGHTLVTAGPYRYLRHPNYLGNAFFAAGIALAAGSRIAWLLVAVLTLSVYLAARHEAAFLRKHLPGYR